ncbi:uncharacterized protein I206_102829 [Kwoniella pini CBS 10737]|uniref:Uncharacterized protein n=1 Tax=Kwoniella pini CBS 10737 TaxID=1296096 RepID=A0A1B9I6H1_9TREE|nr:uncharacterized protein I206_03183 [Kwoniella pini CBS 10737]OCF51117.1 hypothetical protein I206_03183 [Kwoniella pini CBS 10737]
MHGTVDRPKPAPPTPTASVQAERRELILEESDLQYEDKVPDILTILEDKRYHDWFNQPPDTFRYEDTVLRYNPTTYQYEATGQYHRSPSSGNSPTQPNFGTPG